METKEYYKIKPNYNIGGDYFQKLFLNSNLFIDPVNNNICEDDIKTIKRHQKKQFKISINEYEKVNVFFQTYLHRNLLEKQINDILYIITIIKYYLVDKPGLVFEFEKRISQIKKPMEAVPTEVEYDIFKMVETDTKKMVAMQEQLMEMVQKFRDREEINFTINIKRASEEIEIDLFEYYPQSPIMNAIDLHFKSNIRRDEKGDAFIRKSKITASNQFKREVAISLIPFIETELNFIKSTKRNLIIGFILGECGMEITERENSKLPINKFYPDYIVPLMGQLLTTSPRK
jgi:hypothetical protein